MIDNILVEPRKEAYQINEALMITLPDVQGTAELLVSYNEGPWLPVLISLEKTLTYTFDKNGLYAIQLNMMDANSEKFSKWLGQFYVGPVNTKYIQALSYRPYKVTFKPDEPISFMVSPGEFSEDLEFQVLLLPLDAQAWYVAIPWHGWPLPPLFINEEKPTSILVKIRERNSFVKPQSIWITQVYQEYVDIQRDSLLAAILAHHRNLDTYPDVLDASVVSELTVAMYLLYSQYHDISLPNKMTWIKEHGLECSSDEHCHFTTTDGVKLTVSLKHYTISDDMLTLDLNISKYPTIPTVLEMIKAFSWSLQKVYLMTYYLYNHFLYSESNHRPAQPWHGLRDTSSMCLLSANQLCTLLKFMGYSANLLSIIISKENDVVATHAITELEMDGMYYVLDATTGRVGLGTEKSITETKQFPPCIIFPQLWRADEIFDIGTITAAGISEVVPADQVV